MRHIVDWRGVSVSYREVRNRTREEYGRLFDGRTFEKEPHHKQRVENTEALARRFYTGGSILDVGWDSHPIGYRFAEGDYIGIDFLFHYRRGFPRVQAVVSDFDSLPFQNRPLFDMILWCEGPEHSLNPYLTLKGLKPVCKGRIFITCPETTSLNWEHKTGIGGKRGLKELIGSEFKVLEIGDVPPFWIYGVGQAKSVEEA